jgi:diadenosine tetraphosphatase ApaH/serine/threonine PP2A family protein phosphatase
VLDPATVGGTSEVVTERQLAVRQWTFDLLGPDRREVIAGYRPTVRLELDENRALLACHATPVDFHPVVLPSASEPEFRAAFDGADADMVACGHIHLPYVRRIGETLVLNPGSVGLGYDHEADEVTLRFDPWAAWAVVSVGDGRFSVELRRTPFDTEAVAAAHRTSGMPYAEEYAQRWSTG